MVKVLIEAGADPKKKHKTGGGPLFKCVIAKDAELISYLLKQGADPNLEHDDGEYLYDWAEFDYRYDEFDLDLPEEPSEQDTCNADTWLSFLARLAAAYQKQPPDYLILLRKAGALTWSERKEAEVSGSTST